MNKIPMLLTVSCRLYFGTVENLANWQVPTVAAALERVLKVYCHQGFPVVNINADPEFDPLNEIFGDISFNFCSQDEHVPNIECYVWTVKDHARSSYNLLPFEQIPWLMVIRLVANSVFWLNAFPRSNGVSETLSPWYLLTGKDLNYQKHSTLLFITFIDISCSVIHMNITHHNMCCQHVLV
jgi:hypothetical protein